MDGKAKKGSAGEEEGFSQSPESGWLSLFTFRPDSGGGLGISCTPTSHPIEHPHAHHAMQFGNHLNGFDNNIQPYSFRPVPTEYFKYENEAPCNDELFAGDERSDREESTDPADPCYAQLLYQCLKEAPDHTLSLRELYEWVSQHSQKAKDPKNRGWQNSVRHNLSMNAVSHDLPYQIFFSR